MSRYLFLSLSLFLPLAQAAAEAPPNDAHDLAYSLGASLGERLRDEVPDLQIQALVEGLKAAYQGKPLALKTERIEQILTQHDAQISEQSAKSQTEAALENERRFLDQEKAKPGVRQARPPGASAKEDHPAQSADASDHTAPTTEDPAA